MKKKVVFIVMVILIYVLPIGCGKWFEPAAKPAAAYETESTEDYIVVGFSQLGAESDWRSANTESMKSTFTEENGFELLFDDGQQKQANQITAIRNFIQQEVDYIVLAPVTEKGWDTVLQEAKDAHIPVIIVDRMVDVADDSLFTCWIGSDFELEARKATEWLNQYVTAQGMSPKDIHIVNIQGTMGASAQIGRTKGLVDAVDTYGWDLLDEVSGEFTQAKGREVMEYFLNKYNHINVVYCENDNEALGAIDAIEAAGKKVGCNIVDGDILVMSFDGVGESAMQYALTDKITCITECNPLHGPRVRAIIETLEAGEKPDKLTYVDENIFSANDTVKKIMVDETVYNVTILTREVVDQRLESMH